MKTKKARKVAQRIADKYGEKVEEVRAIEFRKTVNKKAPLGVITGVEEVDGKKYVHVINGSTIKIFEL